jgi:DMSO/TMAO reductase YedYZ molybdopterin-dependent catalytic subunit
MSSRIRFILLPALALLALLVLAACAGRQAAVGAASEPAAAAQASDATAEVAQESGSNRLAAPEAAGGADVRSAPYLSLVEGLHVTGTPVAVDVRSYRLHVRGMVDNPLDLTLEEIRAMPTVREEIQLVCPGFFSDNGVWTGVPLRDILARAGVRSGAARVVFTSLSENYTSRISLEAAQADGVLLAYEFNDKPLLTVHGFPLRLAAKGYQGNVWVKWLGDIQVLE